MRTRKKYNYKTRKGFSQSFVEEISKQEQKVSAFTKISDKISDMKITDSKFSSQ